MYYVFKPGVPAWFCLSEHDSYAEAEAQRALMKRPGEYVILKDACPENQYGASRVVYPAPTEAEVVGDTK